jgi:hypothetical protein
MLKNSRDSEVRFDRTGLRTVGGAWGKWDELCEREGTYRRLGFGANE